VLSARSTGIAHTIKANDDVGVALEELGILTVGGAAFVDETAADDAELIVNGSDLITRSKNTGLTDVISGITLSLTGKHTGAEDVDTLSVTANMEGPKTALNSFLTKFNEAVMFLDENTSVTKIADNQYTRGGLAEDTIFSDLRSQLFTAFSDQYTGEYDIGDETYTNSGSYKSMYEIGLSLDDNLNVTISDSTKLENALNNDLDSVKSLLDGVMRTVDFQLGQFTGDNPLKQSGYINNAIKGFDGQIFQIGIDTKDMNVRLDTKQASLVAQYAEMQTQLLNLQYMQQTWSSIYGGMKSFF
jgi:flagellar capping protein FliD